MHGIYRELINNCVVSLPQTSCWINVMLLTIIHQPPSRSCSVINSTMESILSIEICKHMYTVYILCIYIYIYLMQHRQSRNHLRHRTSPAPESPRPGAEPRYIAAGGVDRLLRSWDMKIHHCLVGYRTQYDTVSDGGFTVSPINDIYIYLYII